MAAGRVALTIRATLSETERAVSGMLQRSLLPRRCRVPGLDTAFRYIAGGGGTVGGDWYDVFVLPAGWVCITVGDVVGRGLRAAVVMGRLRSALRSCAGPRARPGRGARPRRPATAALRAGRDGDCGHRPAGPSFDRLHLASASRGARARRRRRAVRRRARRPAAQGRPARPAAVHRRRPAARRGALLLHRRPGRAAGPAARRGARAPA